MAKYIVEIEEVVTYGVELEADNEEQATDIAYQRLAGASFGQYVVDMNYNGNTSAYEVRGEDV